MHKTFVNRIVETIKSDHTVLGVTIGGSWVEQQIDEFSDLDFVIITSEVVSDDKQKMLAYAHRFGDLLNAFTGEHVGEHRLLICLYDNPLLHVDLKFILPKDLTHRVEDPEVLFDRDGIIKKTLKATKAAWPAVDFQWIEDRFWIWIHYLATKIGRGEYLEALDGLAFIRGTVLSPLLQVKNGLQPRGVRKVEQTLPETDLFALTGTIPVYKPESIIAAVDKCIGLYKTLQQEVFGDEIQLHTVTESKCRAYFDEIKKKF